MADNKGATAFTVDDFLHYRTAGGAREYHLQKPCIIFSKVFDREPLEVTIPKKLYGCPPNNKIGDGDYISKINETLKWLGGDSLKSELIKNMCEYYNIGSYDDGYVRKHKIDTEEIIKDNWYDKIEICSVSIAITENGNISSVVYISETYFDFGHFTIKISKDRKISSMSFYR